MFRKTLILAGALALMLVAVRADAAKHDWMIGFSAGTGIPKGDFGRGTTGFIGAVDLDYQATPHLVLGFDGFFVKFGNVELPIEAVGSPVTLKSRMLQGGAHLKYKVSQSTVSPYVLVGLGAYKLMDDTESPDPSYDAHGGYQTFLGTRAGLGLTYKTSEKISIGFEGVLHGVWTSFSWDDMRVREFIGVQTGVSIGMGNPEP